MFCSVLRSVKIFWSMFCSVLWQIQIFVFCSVLCSVLVFLGDNIADFGKQTLNSEHDHEEGLNYGYYNLVCTGLNYFSKRSVKLNGR